MISVCKKAGRPLPAFSSDDVIDYMVTEAIVVKWYDEQEKQQKKEEGEEFKKDFSRLEGLR